MSVLANGLLGENNRKFFVLFWRKKLHEYVTLLKPNSAIFILFRVCLGIYRLSHLVFLVLQNHALLLDLLVHSIGFSNCHAYLHKQIPSLLCQQSILLHMKRYPSFCKKRCKLYNSISVLTLTGMYLWFQNIFDLKMLLLTFIILCCFPVTLITPIEWI